MKDQPVPAGASAATRARPAGKAVSSRQLFGDRREVIIEHGNERYRLQITGSNKLILIK